MPHHYCSRKFMLLCERGGESSTGIKTFIRRQKARRDKVTRVNVFLTQQMPFCFYPTQNKTRVHARFSTYCGTLEGGDDGATPTSIFVPKPRFISTCISNRFTSPSCFISKFTGRSLASFICFWTTAMTSF
mmetsp:Transcript_7688/g.11197  ORF Transcript_7688/g.11197 Transcript_7688/m.11197 type:complete len:131 (-) Transcript_7688:237-629(-)